MQPEPLIRNERAPKGRPRHLCDTCLHKETCSLRADPSEPTYQCEEYDGGSYESVLRPPILVALSERQAHGLVPSSDGLAGLCANCDRRAECTLPKAPGGVWFCEEYQ
jgi:hypothetical protein